MYKRSKNFFSFGFDLLMKQKINFRQSWTWRNHPKNIQTWPEKGGKIIKMLNLKPFGSLQFLLNFKSFKNPKFIPEELEQCQEDLRDHEHILEVEVISLENFFFWIFQSIWKFEMPLQNQLSNLADESQDLILFSFQFRYHLSKIFLVKIFHLTFFR